MKNRLAKGRFSWGKFIITHESGTTIHEDRTDPNWWRSMPKHDITSVSVQLTNGEDIKHTLKGSKNHDYRFFLSRGKEMMFGTGGNSITDQWMTMGMVFNSDGDCIVEQVRSDGSVYSFKTNVFTMKLNLDLHGIDLKEVG